MRPFTADRAALLVLLVALIPFTSAQLASHPDNSIGDVLKTAVFPPIRAGAPGPDVAAEWQQLVQHARAAARAEVEEQVKAERNSGEASGAKGGIKVVRETFYVPLSDEGPTQKGPFAAAAKEAETAATLVGESSRPQVEEAADVRKTVGKLKFLRHPFRFVYRFLLLPLLRSLRFLLSTLFAILVYIVSSALSPFGLVLSVLLTPFNAVYSLNKALLPLWGTLVGAVLAGCGIGALAGLIAGRTTREIIDEAVAVTETALTWVGVLSKEEEVEPKALKVEPSPDDSAEGSRVEMLRVFGSSRAKAKAKEQGRRRESSPDTEDDLAASAGLFHSVTPTLPPVASASYTTASAHRYSPPSSRLRQQNPLPPTFPSALLPGEHPDPPSEELDPRLSTEVVGLQAGQAGSTGRLQVEKAKSGAGKGGWRDRKVEW
ncbi:hypothetical protein JCM11641_001182 [Rhodosporidiobolus odoratus]